MVDCFCSLWENQKGFDDYENSPIEKKVSRSFFPPFFFWREGGHQNNCFSAPLIDPDYRTVIICGTPWTKEYAHNSATPFATSVRTFVCETMLRCTRSAAIMLLCVRCHSSGCGEVWAWIHRLNINFFSFFMDDIRANNVERRRRRRQWRLATAFFAVDVRDHFAFAFAILAHPFVQRTTDGHRSMVCKSVLANNWELKCQVKWFRACSRAKH